MAGSCSTDGLKVGNMTPNCLLYLFLGDQLWIVGTLGQRDNGTMSVLGCPRPTARCSETKSQRKRVSSRPLPPRYAKNECALLAMGVVGFSTLSLPNLDFCPKYSHGLNNFCSPFLTLLHALTRVVVAPHCRIAHGGAPHAHPGQVFLELNACSQGATSDCSMENPPADLWREGRKVLQNPIAGSSPRARFGRARSPLLNATNHVWPAETSAWRYFTFVLGPEPWWWITLRDDTLKSCSHKPGRAYTGKKTILMHSFVMGLILSPSNSLSTMSVVHLLPLPGICSSVGQPKAAE